MGLVKGMQNLEDRLWPISVYIGYETENDVVIQPLEGGQELGQPGLGHVAPGYSSVCNRCATHLDALRN